MNLSHLAVAFAAAVVVAAPAAAQTADPAWTFAGTAGAVSDYRYRGISLSGEDIAVQGGLTASHASGFYGDVYVSSIEEYGLDANGDGSEVEVTLTAGWSGEAAGYVFDLGVAAYRYPGGTDVDYIEFPVSAERAIGPVTVSAGFAYAPEQSALSDEDNRYLWTGVDFAPYGWPVSFSGAVGYEDGGYAPDGKTDWAAGVAAPVGPVVLGVNWVDSDVDDGQLVGSVFVNF